MCFQCFNRKSPALSAEPAPLGCHLSLLPLPREAEPEGAGMIPGRAKVPLGFASELHKPQKAKRFFLNCGVGCSSSFRCCPISPVHAALPAGSRARAALGQEWGKSSFGTRTGLPAPVQSFCVFWQVYCIPRADGERLQNVVRGQVETWAML